jgi:hypothetical protein
MSFERVRLLLEKKVCDEAATESVPNEARRPEHENGKGGKNCTGEVLSTTCLLSLRIKSGDRILYYIFLLPAVFVQRTE